MKQTNIPLIFTVTLAAILLVAGGCGSRQNTEFIPLHPDISSTARKISFLTLEDDYLFNGDWGGVEFDGKNFRTLHGDGSIAFELPEAPSQALMLRFAVKISSPLTMKVCLNQTELKTIELKEGIISEASVLLSKKLLTAGKNSIEMLLSENSAIKFYSWGIIPAGLVNKPVSEDSFVTPARLDYRVWPQEDTLEAKFDQPVKRIVATVSNRSGNVFSRTFDNMKDVRLDLGRWKDEIIFVSLQLQDRPNVCHLVSSGLHRVPPSQKDGNLNKLQESLSRNFNRYNVLVILLDSARADRVSTYGYKRATTPNIDRLVDSSLVFTEAYSEAAYTLASTGSLFSGLAPDYHNAVSNYYGGLPSSVETLAEVFRSKGYLTAAVSAIPYCGSTFNMNQGFDTFIELFNDKKQPLAEEFLPHVEQIFDSALQNKKKFFTYLHIREPHIDFLMEPPFFGTFHKGYETYPNDPFLQRLKDIYFAAGDYKDRQYREEDIALLSDSYDENLLKVDFEVKRILDTLEAKNLANDTIIVILGDHGEGLNEHKLIGHNTILFREGVHIPMIVHIPGITGTKTEINVPVCTTDLTATLKQLINSNSSVVAKDSSKGLFHKMKRKLLVARTIFFSRFYPFYALQEGHYRIIVPFPLSVRPANLFDIASDPKETTPIEDSFVREYFLFQLRNFFRRKNSLQFNPRKTTLKQSEIESLKSLGYL